MTAMRFLTVLLVLMGSFRQAHAAAVIQNLQVEYRNTPLSIDVARPRFSWQMATTAGERGHAQTAYQIQVKDTRGNVVCDTRRIETTTSLGIQYAGRPLEAATRYTWTVSVWNQPGAKLAAGSWFETGLMDPSPDATAWGGAKWIGGGDGDLVLHAPYLAIFDLSYALTIAPGSTRASFVYGANDSRLMDQNKNVYQLQNGRDQSYIKLELDISGVDGTPAGKAKLHVYRVGYKDTDTASKPFRTFKVGTDVIDSANKHAEHVIGVGSAFGQITISIDGKSSLTAAGDGPVPGPPAAGGFGRRMAPNGVNLNPMGAGGNYLPFGLLCEIGFSVEPSQSAAFRAVTVKNNRAPNNVLFREDLAGGVYRGIYADLVKPESGFSVREGRYVLAGLSKGVFVVRNPSRNSMPMLRTTFKTPAKAVERARLYVTVRGIYEIFLNGKGEQRIGRI